MSRCNTDNTIRQGVDTTQQIRPRLTHSQQGPQAQRPQASPSRPLPTDSIDASHALAYPRNTPSYNPCRAKIIDEKYGVKPKPKTSEVNPYPNKEIPLTIFRAPAYKNVIGIRIKSEDNPVREGSENLTRIIEENMYVIQRINECMAKVGLLSCTPMLKPDSVQQIFQKGNEVKIQDTGLVVNYGLCATTDEIPISFASKEGRDDIWNLLDLDHAEGIAIKGEGLYSKAIIFVLP